MDTILIHKGDSSVFANCRKFLTFILKTDLDLTNWSAKFTLGAITKEVTDISSKSFEIILNSSDTAKLNYGLRYGSIILTDSLGNIKTVTNTIPFEVTTKVVETEYKEIDLTIPETSGVDIKLKVGMSGVTSVNGMTGDVVLDTWTEDDKTEIKDYVDASVVDLENVLQNILNAIQTGESASMMIEEIEQLIVSYFENKTAEEVEV